MKLNGLARRIPIRKSWGLPVLAVVTAIIAAACFMEAEDEADPGSERFNALREDPVFEIVPPGTVPDLWEEDRAGPAGPPAQNGVAYEGPSFVRVFEMQEHASPQQTLDFFAEELPEVGWVLVSKRVVTGEQFPSYRYEKDFGDWSATLWAGPYSGRNAVIINMEAPPAVPHS